MRKPFDQLPAREKILNGGAVSPSQAVFALTVSEEVAPNKKVTPSVVIIVKNTVVVGMKSNCTQNAGYYNLGQCCRRQAASSCTEEQAKRNRGTMFASRDRPLCTNTFDSTTFKFENRGGRESVIHILCVVIFYKRCHHCSDAKMERDFQRRVLESD